MSEINNLVAKGFLKEAIALALQQNPSNTDLTLLSSRLAEADRQKNLGMLNHKDYGIERANIVNAILEFAKESAQPQPAQPQPAQPQPTMNKNLLVSFDDLYRDGINRDLKGNSFDESRVRHYVDTLAAIFNMPQVFAALLDPLALSTYKYGSSPEQNAILEEVLKTLVSKHDAWRGRLEVKVKAQNAELTFQETIISFLKNPTIQNWNACKKAVNERLADTSLYGPNVQTAWKVWCTKLDAFDVFDLGFEMAEGTQNNSDFVTWVRNNLNIKNFNYQ